MLIHKNTPVSLLRHTILCIITNSIIPLMVSIKIYRNVIVTSEHSCLLKYPTQRILLQKSLLPIIAVYCYTIISIFDILQQHTRV